MPDGRVAETGSLLGNVSSCEFPDRVRRSLAALTASRSDLASPSQLELPGAETMYKTVRLPRPLNHLPIASLSLTTPSRPACRQLGRAACSTLSQAPTTPANPKNAAPPLRPPFARRPASVRPVSALPLSFRLATRALSRPSRSSGRSAVDASAPSLLVPPRIPSRRRPS
jgi:hypothetical protein